MKALTMPLRRIYQGKGRSWPSRLGWQGGGAGRCVRQSKTDQRRAGQAATISARREDREKLRASVRYRRHGSVVCTRPGEYPQETADTRRRVQSGIAAEVFTRSREA